MPIHGYPGNIVTANPTAPTVDSASGVWTLEQQLQAQAAGNWPSPPLQISRSLRFNSADSAYLNRTPATAGNRQKFTVSVWYKACGIGTSPVNANIINAGGDGSSLLIAGAGAFGATYNDRLLFREAGTTLFYWPMVFRDPSAWYHIVFAMDTTQATAANRAKLYVNGVDQGTFSGTAIGQNTNTSINNTSAHYINTFNGTFYPSSLYYAEYNFIDGSALDPTSFGEFNATTGVWQPIAYEGTYGTNGFFLNFSDNSGVTSTTLGKDYSGNGNNWTPNNFSVTAGAGNDSLVDSPTNYGEDTGAGGEVRGNYCTLNPLENAQGATLSNGNLQAANVSNDKFYRATFGMSSGKWYWEVQFANLQNRNRLGVTDNTLNASGTTLTGDYALVSTGNQSYNTSTASTPTVPTLATNDYICFAYDADAGILYFEKNATPNTSTSPKFTGLSTSKTYFVTCQEPGTASTNIFNFGQRAFQYTATSGFKALCTQNLPESEATIVDGSQYFDCRSRAATGANVTVTGYNFAPDLVWIKSRTFANPHYIADRVRGANKFLGSDTTAAENTSLTNELTAFTSDGYSLGTSTNGYTNLTPSARNYVDWAWKANGAGVVIPVGEYSTDPVNVPSIASTVSANTDSGFSIVTYTGTGANATVGHGLGVAPSFIIVKSRSVSGSNWPCYHVSTGNLGYNYLNLTLAVINNAGYWNSTSPTSSVFSLGNDGANNASGATFVAYCFAAIPGYSAFGKYTGNGSADGPFVYTGFRPAFVMVKNSGATGGSWILHDVARAPYNAMPNYLLPNLANAESSAGSNGVDFLSNGFKWRGSATGGNANGEVIIYMAFAENPFKISRAR